MNEFNTEQLRGRTQQPKTEPFYRPQTGQMARPPEMKTGNLKTPMVRRAPYLYEDDPMREEFAQQIDGGPITRRSSLFIQSEEEE
jgi:hypothetical protein